MFWPVYIIGTLSMLIGLVPFARPKIPQRPLEVGILVVLALVSLAITRFSLYPVRQNTTRNKLLWVLVRVQAIFCLFILAEVARYIGFERY